MSNLSIEPSAQKASSAMAATTTVLRALDFSGEKPQTYRSNDALQHAELLRVTDQPRFQKYKEVLVNFDSELAQNIIGHFNPKKPAGAIQDYVQQNIGDRLPSELVNKKELCDLAVVSVALSKYGAAQLNELYDGGKMTGFRDVAARAFETRDEKNQRAVHAKYDKDGKHAAHRAALDVVVKVNLTLPEPHRVAADVLKRELNRRSNFRREEPKTNLPGGLHFRVDAKILQALRGETVQLDRDERRRLQFITKFYQSEPFQNAMIEDGGEHLYAKLRDLTKAMDPLDGWDESKDLEPLTDAAVTAYLKKDRTPDRRRKENKGLQKCDLTPLPRDTAAAAMQANAATTTTSRRTRQSAKAAKAAVAATPPPPPPAALKASKTTLSKAPPAPAPAPVRRTSVSASPGARSIPQSAAAAQQSVTTPVHLKKDGTPNMRYAVNRTAFSSSAAKSATPTPVRNTTRTPSPTPATYASSSSYSAGGASTRASSSSSRGGSGGGTTASSGGGSGGREIFTGPRGGSYYINSNGNKTYV